MKYFKRGFGLQLKKFLSIALSISMVTLAMPIKVSAQGFRNVLPQPRPEFLAQGKCANIEKIVINRPLGLMTHNVKPLSFKVEAIGVQEDGKYCTGKNLTEACDGISWGTIDILQQKVMLLVVNTGFLNEVVMGTGKAAAQVTATCNNKAAVKGGDNIGRLLMNEDGNIMPMDENVVRNLLTPPEELKDALNSPPPPRKPSSGGAGVALIVGAVVVGGLALGAAAAAGGGGGSTSGGGTVATGLCSTDSDCNGFDSRNCGGLGRCGSDRLCHCCQVTCPGGNCYCNSCGHCQTTNALCIEGVCTFPTGGRTNQ